MTKKQIKKVIIINAIVVCLLINIIISASGETPTASGAVFLWSWVGKKIMERVLLEDEKDESIQYQCMSCGYINKDYFDICPQCGTGAKQYIYSDTNSKPNSSEQNNKTTFTENTVEDNTQQSFATVRYCRKCGNKLSQDSQYCCRCGTKIIDSK